MTVTEAQAVLFDYFLGEDVFKMSDVKKIFLSIENEEIDKGIARLALQELESLKLIRSFRTEDEEEYWVLIKSLFHYNQDVAISSLTANTIASIINKKCEELGDEDNYCNPAIVNETDIQNLLKLILNEDE